MKYSVVILFMSLIMSSAFGAALSGTIMVSKGIVKVKSGASTIDAKIGAKVQEGDLISTGADSRAKIVMSDRNVINLNPDTELKITTYQNDPVSGTKNVELNLLNGKVRNNIEQNYDGAKSKFLIKTPTAVAGVRGTQFLTGYDKLSGISSFVTFKGSVQVASVSLNGEVFGRAVDVKKGETSKVESEKSPEPPRAIPKQEMRQMDIESTAMMKPPEAPGVNNPNPQERGLASEGSKDQGGMKPPPPPPMSMVTLQDIDPKLATQIREVREVLMPPPQPRPIPPPAFDNSAVRDAIRDSVSKTHVTVKPIIN